jgi:acetyltransferase-like isoleucine patch superfamily enzyme
LDHQVVVGAGCEIGGRAYVGREAVVRDGVRVAPGIVVPAKTVLATQADADGLAARQGVERAPRPTARFGELTPVAGRELVVE